MKKCQSSELNRSLISKRKIRWYLKKVGENVRCARLRRGLTQGQLAKMVGCGQFHISRMEWGDQRMHLELLYKFAMALGVMPQELVDPTIDGRFWVHRIQEKGGDISIFNR